MYVYVHMRHMIFPSYAIVSGERSSNKVWERIRQTRKLLILFGFLSVFSAFRKFDDDEVSHIRKVDSLTN